MVRHHASQNRPFFSKEPTRIPRAFRSCSKRNAKSIYVNDAGVFHFHEFDFLGVALRSLRMPGNR